MSRVLANKSHSLFHNVAIDCLLYVMPSRMNTTVTYNSHCLPTFWVRFEAVIPLLPAYAPRHRADSLVTAERRFDVRLVTISGF